MNTEESLSILVLHCKNARFPPTPPYCGLFLYAQEDCISFNKNY